MLVCEGRLPRYGFGVWLRNGGLTRRSLRDRIARGATGKPRRFRWGCWGWFFFCVMKFSKMRLWGLAEGWRAHEKEFAGLDYESGLLASPDGLGGVLGGFFV